MDPKGAIRYIRDAGPNLKEGGMIVAVTSPDPVSIGMFTDFLTKKGFLPGASLVNINALLSEEAQTKIVEEALSDMPGRDIVFRHKTRRRMTPSKVPALLMERADCVIGFDLYSMHPEVLKSSPGWTENVVPAFESAVSDEDT